MLSLKNLVVYHDGSKIINNLTLEIINSSITCIIAPNGTGKTTLFKAITNNLKKVSGTVKINGFKHDNRKRYNKQLFFLEDTQNLISNFTAIEYLKLVKALWGSNSNIETIIDSLEITTFKDKLIKKMSLGMKQKVLIASAIASDADILIFDEPLNGLDIKNIELITQTFSQLKKDGKTIIMSSHNVYDITDICDNIYFLNKGQLIYSKNNYALIKEKYFELYK